MAPAFRPPAASTARRLSGLRTALAVAVVGLSLSSTAMLASGTTFPGLTAPFRTAGPAAIATAAAIATPAAGTLTDAAATPRAPGTDVGTAPTANGSPEHGAPPPPQCHAGPAAAAQARVVRHGSQTTKVIALTFDDGWNEPNVRKILAILERYKVAATFFPTGQAIKSAPDVWRAVALARFPIGNHTYDHKNLQQLCQGAQLAELARHDAVVLAELGIAVQPYMRPPYGAYDDATRFAAAMDGERAVVMWDVDTRDWSGLSAGSITARAMAGTNGSIIIMHTFATNTVSALPSIIARYRARGFTFVTIGQLLGIDGPTPFPLGPARRDNRP